MRGVTLKYNVYNWMYSRIYYFWESKIILKFDQQPRLRTEPK